MEGCQEMLENAYFSHIFLHFRPNFFFLAELPIPSSKQYTRLILYQKSEKSMDWLQRNAQKRILFTHFSPFSAKKICSCKTAYAIFEVVYQASLIPKIRKNYGLVAEKCSKTHIFHTLFAIFGPKKCFLAKLPMPYLKQYIRLVTYQKSEKSMVWLPRNAKKCVFFTPFSLFLAKNFFF